MAVVLPLRTDSMPSATQQLKRRMKYILVIENKKAGRVEALNPGTPDYSPLGNAASQNQLISNQSSTILNYSFSFESKLMLSFVILYFAKRLKNPVNFRHVHVKSHKLQQKNPQTNNRNKNN